MSSASAIDDINNDDDKEFPTVEELLDKTLKQKFQYNDTVDDLNDDDDEFLMTDELLNRSSKQKFQYTVDDINNEDDDEFLTIHEVEMKQFQLFWMVEMVKINFDFLIKF